MKVKMCDLKQFRFSKLNDPQFSHLKLLVTWIIYFAFYFLTENLIPAESCHVIYSPLDDIIPFNEYFLIPYCSWYVLIVISLYYFAEYNVESFKKLQIFIALTQLFAMIIYIVYPNRQDLRPEVFPRDNFLTDVMKFIYRFDTNTGVCPSLHVAYSVGIASVWMKKKDEHIALRLSVLMLCAVICISTAFVKQHSVVDIYYGLLISVIPELILYGKYYLNKIKSHRNKLLIRGCEKT